MKKGDRLSSDPLYALINGRSGPFSGRTEHDDGHDKTGTCCTCASPSFPSSWYGPWAVLLSRLLRGIIPASASFVNHPRKARFFCWNLLAYRLFPALLHILSDSGGGFAFSSEDGVMTGFHLFAGKTGKVPSSNDKKSSESRKILLSELFAFYSNRDLLHRSVGRSGYAARKPYPNRIIILPQSAPSRSTQ